MGSEAIVEVPVVIVGGGGCGLNLSIFLSDFGVEKHAGTSILPKAHYLNQRTMEIFRQHNMAEWIKKVGCPIRNMGRTDWRSSLGGDGPYDRRVIGTVPSFGGTIRTPDHENYKKTLRNSRRTCHSFVLSPYSDKLQRRETRGECSLGLQCLASMIRATMFWLNLKAQMAKLPATELSIW